MVNERHFMAIALEDLKLEILYVVHPGKIRFPISPKVEAIPLYEALTQITLS